MLGAFIDAGALYIQRPARAMLSVVQQAFTS
jgi:hypothetical protein